MKKMVYTANWERKSNLMPGRITRIVPYMYIVWSDHVGSYMYMYTCTCIHSERARIAANHNQAKKCYEPKAAEARFRSHET